MNKTINIIIIFISASLAVRSSTGSNKLFDATERQYSAMAMARIDKINTSRLLDVII